jgi:hypothetical protein
MVVRGPGAARTTFVAHLTGIDDFAEHTSDRTSSRPDRYPG